MVFCAAKDDGYSFLTSHLMISENWMLKCPETSHTERPEGGGRGEGGVNGGRDRQTDRDRQRETQKEKHRENETHREKERQTDRFSQLDRLPNRTETRVQFN